MSNKGMLEVSDRIAALEARVATLEQLASVRPYHSADVSKVVRDRYKFLADYLYNSGKDVVELTFSEIEQIIKRKFAPSIRKNRGNWSNTTKKALPRAWVRVGYRLEKVDMAGERVRFERQ